MLLLLLLSFLSVGVWGLIGEVSMAALKNVHNQTSVFFNIMRPQNTTTCGVNARLNHKRFLTVQLPTTLGRWPNHRRFLTAQLPKNNEGAQLPETFKNQEEEEEEEKEGEGKEEEEEGEEEEEEEEPTRVRGPKRLVCHIVPHAAP